MKLDELSIIEDISRKRVEQPKDNVFKKFSPSNKRMFLISGGIASVLLITIFVVFKSSSPIRETVKSNDYIAKRLMPSEEITPEYIANIGNALEKKTIESKKATDPIEGKKTETNTNNLPAQGRQLSSMNIMAGNMNGGSFSQLGLPLGTELNAVLENTVIAGDASVPVIARLTNPYSSNGKIIIPINSRIFGSTQGMVEDRVNVKFERIVFPDGKVHQFSGIALDDKGSGGLSGSVKRKVGRRGWGVVTQAALGAASVFAPTGAGFTNSAVRGAQSGTANEVSRDLNYYQKTEGSPVVTIKARTRLTVLIDRDN